MISWILLIALVFVVLFIAFAFWFAKNLIWFGLNSLLGLMALTGWNILFPDVAINIWSVLLVAIFGIFGLIAVVLLHLFCHLQERVVRI